MLYFAVAIKVAAIVSNRLDTASLYRAVPTRRGNLNPRCACEAVRPLRNRHPSPYPLPVRGEGTSSWAVLVRSRVLQRGAVPLPLPSRGEGRVRGDASCLKK